MIHFFSVPGLLRVQTRIVKGMDKHKEAKKEIYIIKVNVSQSELINAIFPFLMADLKLFVWK